jgi:hypothetical protein
MATRNNNNGANTMKAGQIIWQQIPVMTKMACGARQAVLTNEGKGVQFKVTNKPYRFVEVVLDEGADLYNVEHFRVKRGSYVKVSMEAAQGVFAEDLGETIYHMVNK